MGPDVSSKTAAKRCCPEIDVVAAMMVGLKPAPARRSNWGLEAARVHVLNRPLRWPALPEPDRCIARLATKVIKTQRNEAKAASGLSPRLLPVKVRCSSMIVEEISSILGKRFARGRKAEQIRH